MFPKIYLFLIWSARHLAQVAAQSSVTISARAVKKFVGCADEHGDMSFARPEVLQRCFETGLQGRRTSSRGCPNVHEQHGICYLYYFGELGNH